MSSSGYNPMRGPDTSLHRDSRSRVRVVSLSLGLVLGIVAGAGAASATVGAEEYSAYSDPGKPVISYLLSDGRNAEDFREEFALGDEEMERVLAAIRKENEALSREYAQSERIVEANGKLPREKVKQKIAASDYDETVREAVARTKDTVEGILPADRRAELEAWVDEKWRAETREYQTSGFSGSSTYEFSATGITCKRIFATQYDGYTRFEVALPHRKLKFDSGYKVRVRRGARYVWAPVKEVGPWNTYDNYWQSARYRTMWEDLPRCKNQSKAAYYNNYNDGEDEFGRKVLNPAGIDLTPAVARKLGLAKYENTWVYVRFPWVRR